MKYLFLVIFLISSGMHYPLKADFSSYFSTSAHMFRKNIGTMALATGAFCLACYSFKKAYKKRTQYWSYWPRRYAFTPLGYAAFGLGCYTTGAILIHRAFSNH